PKDLRDPLALKGARENLENVDHADPKDLKVNMVRKENADPRDPKDLKAILALRGATDVMVNKDPLDHKVNRVPLDRLGPKVRRGVTDAMESASKD
ncbi:MAG TPA: hypothetical protein VKR58_00325, partial [Aquella sp.]|nr:hypothetical protein [Aquella sp.]